MGFTFNKIDRGTYEAAIAKQSHRASEPRDSIHKYLVQPFLDFNEEVSAKSDDDGTLTGYTWDDVMDMVPEMVDAISRKDKPLEIGTIQSTINQTQNRDRWHVYCKVVKNADGTVGFVLINETLEKANRKAAQDAAKTSDADAKQDAA